jgi:uncharacterized membrane protein
MSWYELLLFVHVSCAVIWIGGGFTLQMYGLVVRRGGDPGEIGQFAGRAGHLGERLFAPTAILVILAGIGLMFEGNWDWGQLWVIFALVTFAASFAVGLFVLTPLAKRLPLVGPATPEGQELIGRIFAILRVDLAFLFAIVFAMTVKPTSDDGWVVLAAALVLVALTALFLAPLRGGGAPEAPAAAAAE